jgi:tyrosine-protein kinase Etk/Wzc
MISNMQAQQQEIDLSKVVLVLKENKKRIAISTGITTLIAIVYCLIATPIFTAATIINPPKLTDAGSGAAQLIGGLAALGGGGLLNQKTDADVTIAIMKTNAMKDMIISKFDLQKLLKKKDIELTRRTLDSKVKFTTDMKSGFVEIDVDDKDPTLAAAVANYYVIALGQMVSNISYGKSNIKYQFFNQQLEKAESSLNTAEEAVKQFALQNGIIAGQQVIIVANLATQLQAQLVVAQAQLQAMSLYASPDNPDYIELNSQIASYKGQLDKLNNSASPDPIGVPAGLAPELAKQYAGLMRDVMFRQEVYKIIARQYEANRLDSVSELTPVGIQVVDPAVIPLYKSKPKRLNILVGGFMLGLIANSVYFILRNRKKIIVEINENK